MDGINTRVLIELLGASAVSVPVVGAFATLLVVLLTYVWTGVPKGAVLGAALCGSLLGAVAVTVLGTAADVVWSARQVVMIMVLAVVGTISSAGFSGMIEKAAIQRWDDRRGAVPERPRTVAYPASLHQSSERELYDDEDDDVPFVGEPTAVPLARVRRTNAE